MAAFYCYGLQDFPNWEEGRRNGKGLLVVLSVSRCFAAGSLIIFAGSRAGVVSFLLLLPALPPFSTNFFFFYSSFTTTQA